MALSATESREINLPGQVSSNAAGSTFAGRMIASCDSGIEFRNVLWPLTNGGPKHLSFR